MTSTAELRHLGERLRRAGLTEHALLAWAGTRRLSALARRTTDLLVLPSVPAALALSLFVAGREHPADAIARVLPLDELLVHGLVDQAGTTVRATVAILPLERALLVCDRADSPDDVARVCWPDDSSYHLAAAIPAGRRGAWNDLATGSAFAPLARPELASSIVGVDLNPRAVRHATLGAALTGIAHLAVTEGDIAVPVPPAPLVTCNAPILDDPGDAMWRRADARFFTRMLPAARAALASGGEVILHSTLDALPDDLPGQVVSVAYTPPIPGERAFAITWWAPDAADRHVQIARALTAARPHLDPRDRDDALADRV